MFLETKRDGEATTKPDIYAPATLIAWLERHPKEKNYNFLNCNGECLLSQYLTDCGISNQFGDGKYAELSRRTGWGFCVAQPEPWTFGAALTRARVAHAEGATQK